ncbi:hypothetical protein SAMN05660841_00138 [Sphingobacterium nematocida]|uniref:Uncharacterized protein n=1 Tax=Sphingobacterium nematocida TaxID=1513896 RepID=A0A1T5AT23_9SPHI|nr:hypothetical protein [Sphingobacterium nematocida]SKB38056.1 hypothetical protein SAMN05660841_00138 [Sphingobacterium nematocida]
MHKVKLNAPQSVIGGIIRKTTANVEGSPFSLGSKPTWFMESSDICDVILPGMDPIPMDR